MRTAVLYLALVLTAGNMQAVPASVADAAQRGDLDRVRALLRDGADVNAPQGDGMTALHWSALTGNADIVNILLVAGAATDPLTRVGRYTPLHLAARAGTRPWSRACSRRAARPRQSPRQACSLCIWRRRPVVPPRSRRCSIAAPA